MKDLTFDQIIFKASHNSYERKETLNEQLTFNSNEPYNCGCMGIELDIWRHSSEYVPYKNINDGYFTVAHTTPGNTTLSSYLQELLNWHKSNLEHNIILITLDIKSSQGGYNKFHKEIDTYLKCYFKEGLIFKPHKLKKDSSLSLCENVIKTGWPKLSSSDLKGKFIFCLSGNKDWKSEYARTDLNSRYCFSDKDKSASDKEVLPPSRGDIVFFNFHIYNKNRDVWTNTIPSFAKKGLITRTYISNSENNWNNSIKANVSAIATDKISNHDWAKVSDSCEYQEKKEYFNKRYLKNKANKEYRTDHATRMRDTYKSPDCTFIFEKQDNANNVYALRNAKNNEYLDCSITTMSRTVNDTSQQWELKEVNSKKSEYYVKNLKNNKYLTKKASKLSDNAGDDEIYIINSVD